MSYLLELENTIAVMKSERRNVYILMGYAIFMVFKENNRCAICIRTGSQVSKITQLVCDSYAFFEEASPYLLEDVEVLIFCC